MRRDLGREKDELWNTARDQLIERCVFMFYSLMFDSTYDVSTGIIAADSYLGQ
jgi:hypothetical protein